MPDTPQHISRFLDYLKFEKRYSRHTIIGYETDLQQFFDYLALQFQLSEVKDIQSSYIRSWLASLKEDDLTAKSINRKISSLKSFFKYQLKTGEVKASPMGSIVSPKIRKSLPVYVEQKDMNTLLDHVEFTADWNGKTHRLLIQIFYNTGMRLSELINLKENNIDNSNNSLKVLGKGNKERVIPMNKELLAAISEYMLAKHKELEAPDKTVLLVDDKGRKLKPAKVYAIVKRYLGMVTTIDKKSPHVLRHSFATHLMNNGAELNAVKELLGHSSLAATQVYTHNTIEKLKEIHKKAHPKA